MARDCGSLEDVAICLQINKAFQVLKNTVLQNMREKRKRFIGLFPTGK
jgi:hypothetical protein